MSRAVSPASGRPYGLAAVCRAWRLARSGVYRRRAPAPPSVPPSVPPRRRGPVGPMPDADLVAAIRAVLAASPFHGEGGTGRSGPGCATAASAPRSAGCCG
jgi:putative transposase